MLDHLVINTRFQMDVAAALFERLGFQLTPRGHHSLGSINHLVMFPDHYLELIGLPTSGAALRQEVLDSVVGIDGLVFAIDDAPATAARLAREGIDAQPVQRFSRPAEIDGENRTASFETVRLVAGQYPAGRIYYCHHLTPEWVWRDAWLAHPNGVTSIASLEVISDDPAAAERDYARLTARADVSAAPRAASFHLRFAHREAAARRFGPLSVFLPPRPESFASMAFRLADGASLSALAERGRQAGLPVRHHPAQDGAGARLMIALPTFHTLLEFLG
ncbi:VOC family protein [Robbsia sp. Bb-Pol-6]|uniref:VOC family protein n=1 Tax=Robbsia betulipollinis TaxID=2981849 RepID=A0ABT3ZJR0_9BURK|nr:VOC family protein [Robbsia betulipollinis]MCY0386755.1 VOC family protein [Robbsia betulipollinis]